MLLRNEIFFNCQFVITITIVTFQDIAAIIIWYFTIALWMFLYIILTTSITFNLYIWFIYLRHYFNIIFDIKSNFQFIIYFQKYSFLYFAIPKNDNKIFYLLTFNVLISLPQILCNILFIFATSCLFIISCQSYGIS